MTAQLHLSNPDFRLRNVDNQMISLESYPDAKGFILVFTCNHCPFAKLYSEKLNELHEKYESIGVPLLAINPMDTLVYEEESFEMMQEKAKNDKFKFPYLQDDLQLAGKYFNAKNTPEVFIIWRENGNWILKYRGAIDDNSENKNRNITYIDEAVDALLLNKPVNTPETPSFGCKIYYRK